MKIVTISIAPIINGININSPPTVSIRPSYSSCSKGAKLPICFDEAILRLKDIPWDLSVTVTVLPLISISYLSPLWVVMSTSPAYI
jgi:hypothetical protein